MERLLDSLTDPARRERSVAAALLCYVALWTLYGILAKASQDVHVDMSEQFALARELALGYPKHPPLTMAVVRAWFAVFPAADWAYYLLAMANVGLTLWIVWRLMARFVDGEKRVVGLALLTLVPFFNFHALKFNVNTVLMPLWAVTTLWFLRSFETQRPLDAALAGLAARCPVPVDLQVELPDRPPAAIEATAYFVVGEALTNVAKHSQARSVRVRVARRGPILAVEVTDDGVGGAVVHRSGGLAGLADRVRAVEGTLRLASPAGGPTTLLAELPCAS
jgi:hypothetical protein